MAKKGSIMAVDIIDRKDHPLVKRFLKLKANRDFRHELKRVMVEGNKLVHDLSRITSYHHLLVKTGSECIFPIDHSHVAYVSEAIMKHITQLPSPPCLAAELDLPVEKSLRNMKWVLALDHIQDPGNVGTLLRTALALGYEGAFLIQCADPFHDKAIRASQGAPFMLPFRTGTLEDFIRYAEEENHTCMIAQMKGKKPEKIESGILVLGSEGQGISTELKKFPAVSIPVKHIESLNVSAAGAILMASLKGF